MGCRSLAITFLAAACVACLALALPSAAPGASPARAAPLPKPPESLHEDLLAAMEVFERGGRWKDADSAMLGWSCGQQLQALVFLYQATGERVWLDRLLKYAETMFASLTPNRDGFLSWRSRRYSSAYAEVQRGPANRSGTEMEPKTQWLSDARVSRQVKDGRFRLIAHGSGTLKVESGQDGQPLPAVRYQVGKAFSGPFGIRLTPSAAPAEGDTFTLITRRPKDFDYAVHEGMVLMPICRAIELVKRDGALRPAYGERADKLLGTIETQLIPKWNRYWRETKRGGLLVFPKDPAFDPSGATLPHNQYLPLGTVQITLYRITGKPVYKERATKMARFFKSCLRLVGNHYEWNYWDAAGEWDKPWDKPQEKRPEDTGHGSLDIGFVLACAESGIVFTETDLKRFAKTLLEAMWNGSLEEPTVGGYVNSPKPSRQSGNLHEWLMLCNVEPKVRPMCEPVILREGSLWAKAQLYLLRSDGAAKAPGK